MHCRDLLPYGDFPISYISGIISSLLNIVSYHIGISGKEKKSDIKTLTVISNPFCLFLSLLANPINLFELNYTLVQKAGVLVNIPIQVRCLGARRKLNASQCYETFQSCNLKMFIIRWNVCLFKPFKPSLMFVSMANTYPSKAPFRCPALG